MMQIGTNQYQLTSIIVDSPRLAAFWYCTTIALEQYFLNTFHLLYLVLGGFNASIHLQQSWRKS